MAEKFVQIQAHASPEDDWHKEIKPQQLKKAIARWIRDSRFFQAECKKYNLAFFNASFDFEKTLNEAERFFTEK